MGCGCSKPEVPSPKVYRFGAIFSESGPYAFVGQPGAEVLRALSGSEVHGARLEFVVRDTHGNKAQALQEYRQMAQDPSILGVIGPSTTDETLALLQAAIAGAGLGELPRQVLFSRRRFKQTGARYFRPLDEAHDR